MLQQSRSVLIKQWASIYNSKDSKFILVGNVEGYKYRKQKNHFVIYNKSYPNKKDGGLIKTAREKKTVFLAFDSQKNNYSNLSNKEIMFHINLDEEELITKENTYKITQNFFDKNDDENDQIEGHAHPVLINTTPVCKNHSILLMYPDQELPQIVGQDIILLLLNIFKLFPNIIIGYNSLGASAIINHLHFHLLFADDLIGGEKLPIEFVERKLWKKSSLINPKQQINLYNVGVKIEQFDNAIAQGFVISPLGENNDPSENASSLSFVFGIISNELIQLCIPHNVCFTNGGNNIYIILRQFASDKTMYGWLQFCGVVIVDNEKDYGLSQEEIVKKKKDLRIEAKLIESLKKNITKNLQNYI